MKQFLSSVLNMVLSAYPSKTQLNQRVKLNCVVRPAKNLLADIMFVRQHGKVNETCGKMHQGRSRCYQATTKPGYHTYCQPSSNSPYTEMKEYRLLIKKTSKDDFTTWWCQTPVIVHTHNSIILEENSSK